MAMADSARISPPSPPGRSWIWECLATGWPVLDRGRSSGQKPSISMDVRPADSMTL